jgi:1,4-dihydroxy-2-naphthoyl-CoA hydrolase
MKKAIWTQPLTLEGLNARNTGTMGEALGIVFTEVGDDYLKATMPVDHRTKQPAGILHGGASVALAETLGSIAGFCTLDGEAQYCVGLEINANHIRACSAGVVEGIARPLHLGKSTQVWETRITQDEKLVCVSRLTLAVLSRKATSG